MGDPCLHQFLCSMDWQGSVENSSLSLWAPNGELLAHWSYLLAIWRQPPNKTALCSIYITYKFVCSESLLKGVTLCVALGYLRHNWTFSRVCLGITSGNSECKNRFGWGVASREPKVPSGKNTRSMRRYKSTFVDPSCQETNMPDKCTVKRMTSTLMKICEKLVYNYLPFLSPFISVPRNTLGLVQQHLFEASRQPLSLRTKI